MREAHRRFRTRSGDLYKPLAIRSYEASLRLRVFPEMGTVRLAQMKRQQVQAVVDALVAVGHSPSTIQATIIPLRAICRREVSRGRMAVNPTTGLELPAIRGGRDHIANPAEAVQLLEALPDEDRALWAIAMYGGLRRGELQALRVNRVDLSAGLIHVERGWDAKEGEIETKGRNTRRVPVAALLREHLLAHLVRSGVRDDDLVFGRTATTPFAPGTVYKRAYDAWGGQPAPAATA